MQKYRKSFTFNGRRYYVRGNSIKQVNEKIKAKKAELLNPKIKNDNRISFKSWAEICLKTYKPGVKSVTMEGYRQRLNCYIYPYIGNKPLEDIKPFDCQSVINSVSDKSDYIIKQTAIMMRFIFERALDNDLIVKNPAKPVILPRGAKSERRALTSDERERIVRAFSDPVFLPFKIMYYCGLRPSEIRNLRGGQIEDINGLKMLHVRGTKSRAADRFIPCEPVYNEIIKVPAGELVCLSYNGYALNKMSFKWLWNKLKKDAGLNAADLVPYCLRHDYCTRLFTDGVDLRAAQYLMGHSKIELTAQIYTHITPESISNMLQNGTK